MTYDKMMDTMIFTTKFMVQVKMRRTRAAIKARTPLYTSVPWTDLIPFPAGRWVVAVNGPM